LNKSLEKYRQSKVYLIKMNEDKVWNLINDF